MLSKNNRKLQERKLQEKQRFGFRKYSFGLASALIGVSFMLGTGSTVSAADTNTQAETVAGATTNNTNPGTGTPDTSNSDADELSTTDTSATDTKADTIEASKTAADSSATTVLKAAAVATDASATITSGDGKITDEGKAKVLTDSDVDPEMSDANGASLVADNSNIPNGYKADSTEGRYTFVIVNLGPETPEGSNDTTYNKEFGTNYYLRLSTNTVKYDETAYVQLIDANSDSVVWE